VLPVVAANRVEAIKSDHVLTELVRLIPTPGHTIDHFSVHVGKPGQDALIAGDMIHSPIQARYTELGMRADYDQAPAGASLQGLRSLLRQRHPAVHGALPVPVHGTDHALG
jgi:glyoxylase-like metal-dependent hydrolase (beta-lactamase superfamily II)